LCRNTMNSGKGANVATDHVQVQHHPYGQAVKNRASARRTLSLTFTHSPCMQALASGRFNLATSQSSTTQRNSYTPTHCLTRPGWQQVARKVSVARVAA